MLIQVEYLDGTFDFVKEPHLTSLISTELISKFLRSDGWVKVPSDEIRKPFRKRSYEGSERRGDLEEQVSSAWSDLSCFDAWGSASNTLRSGKNDHSF